jgi:hypothetical protein
MVSNPKVFRDDDENDDRSPTGERSAHLSGWARPRGTIAAANII